MNKIIQGDAFEQLKLLDTESVDCIITSPPYYQLRKYGNSEYEFGHEESVKLFIDNLTEVFMECHRVLKKDGTLYIVIGDTYNGGSNAKNTKSKENYSEYEFRKNDFSIQKKSLIGIPERLMISLIDRGWICRNNIIWHKPNAMPSSVKDRFTIDYENILFFTKSQMYYFNQLKEPMKTTDTNSPRGSNGTLGELNNGLRQLRKRNRTISNKQDEIGRSDYTGFNDRYKAPYDLMRNKRSVWSISTESSPIKHYAMFPKELVEQLLESGAKPGGVVLDPFAGAGTTLRYAKLHGYQYIGIELYEKNCKIIEDRLNKTPILQKLF
ncbi:MAG: site-specific DNA-methyltransferase [Acholeplasmataceae bacterium]